MVTAAPVAAGRVRRYEDAQQRLGVIAAMPPHTGGAAPFNAAMVAALRDRGPLELVSWRRLYPPLFYRGREADVRSLRGPGTTPFVLDWHNPRTWREAVHRLAQFGAEAVVLPWLHPISAPPYRWLLRHVKGMQRVVVCHNVLPHEHVPAESRLARATLRHADLLVTHAPQQAEELRKLGLGSIPVLHAFHPRFIADQLAPTPDAAAVAAERRRLGEPGLLLVFFGAVRFYKGLDVALEALAKVDPKLDARMVVAGRFWEGRERYDQLVARLGISTRVEIRDSYLSDQEAALLFSAADAAVLPYRSATQSGVAQLAFAYGTPVVATCVGGLPAAIEHGRTGLLCPPDDPAALARLIESFAQQRPTLAAGVAESVDEQSFRRYAALLGDALREAA
jgi:glycosyltransferase involved in cell wall biosynthesis